MLQARLLRQISRANKRFDLIQPNDKVMVALSGGKDSWALLHLLRAYRAKVPFDFSLVAVNIDQGDEGFPAHLLREHLDAHGFDHNLVRYDTRTVVKEKTPEGKAMCALCSRMRRGILYKVAAEIGAQRIALGHHRDDLIETLLLNLFYSGRTRSMAARIDDPDGGPTIIRPMAFCAEDELAEYATEKGVPIIPCDLCGSQEQLKRKEVKRLLASLEVGNPRIRGNLLAALGNVDPSHLLDARLKREGASGDDDEAPCEPTNEPALVQVR